MELPAITYLGPDPPTIHRLNACSYQQDAITTFAGWQYAAFYTAKSASKVATAEDLRYVNIARRRVDTGTSGEWETIAFTDYEQKTDDGHNTISIGISHGDGTIHLSYDHHCDLLNLRSSVVGLANDPAIWSPTLFHPNMNYVPGILSSNPPFESVSYPRFCNIGMDLLLEYRIGKAGEGSNVLFRYSSITHTWSYQGIYLTGIASNPYPNGLTFKRGRLHVSWTYRHFTPYVGSSDPTSTAHRAHAGPNGPENNADLCYSYSDDGGRTWYSTSGKEIANLSKGETILPSTKGITAFKIPKGSGVLNQEGQCADAGGSFHVLNRQHGEGGVERWYHYFLTPSGAWDKFPILGLTPTDAGDRGAICTDGNSNVFFLLPGNGTTTLTLVKASRESMYNDQIVVWEGEGWAGEPLVDERRLMDWGVMSVFTRTAGRDGERKVTVLDFDLGKAAACATLP